MSDRRKQTLKSLPMANFIPAVARAVEGLGGRYLWLGDRYLLAKPINAAPARQPLAGARISTWVTGDAVHADGKSTRQAPWLLGAP
jgi:hypothetical protein